MHEAQFSTTCTNFGATKMQGIQSQPKAATPPPTKKTACHNHKLRNKLTHKNRNIYEICITLHKVTGTSIAGITEQTSDYKNQL